MAKKFDAKAKAKRQKIILGVLCVVFLGVLGWQVPSVLKMMNEKPATSAAPPPAPVAPVTPVAGTPGTATPAAPAGALIDSDPAAQAASGQLVSFDRFESKDPFAPQVRAGGTSSGSAGSPAPTKSPPPPSEPKPAAVESEPAPPAQASSAEITVNGERESVAVGGTFPQSDPMFVLVSVGKTSAKVAISGGSLDSGGAAVTLNKGKKLTLENTVDGSRYTLVLVAVR